MFVVNLETEHAQTAKVKIYHIIGEIIINLRCPGMEPDVSEVDLRSINYNFRQEVHIKEHCKYIQSQGTLISDGVRYDGVLYLVRKCVCRRYNNILPKWRTDAWFDLPHDGIFLIFYPDDHVRKTKHANEDKWDFKLITHGKRAKSGHSYHP